MGRHPRPHELKALAAFLGLGVLTTLVVAWGIAILAAPLPLVYTLDQRLVVPRRADGAGSTWLVHQQSRRGRRGYTYEHIAPPFRGVPVPLTWLPPTIDERDIPRWARPPTTSDARMVRQAGFGWPLVAVSGRRDTYPGRFEMLGYHVFPGWSASSGDIWLPLRPSLSGLAIDSLFWATAWWVVVALPGVLVRERRLRRGLCPRCAYDLRGTAATTTVCPECGHGHTPALPS